jgi:hypothetical protein
VRSFITSLADDATVPVGRETLVRGIAFDGGQGIAEVVFSSDGGATWQPATLGANHGRYSFHEWTARFTAARKGALQLKVRATSRGGDTQPLTPRWNPPGYMRNVVETVKVTAV